MAVVATEEKRIPLGLTESLSIGTIALDNSYPTGGEVIAIDKMEKIDRLFVQGGGYIFEFVPSSQKLKVLIGDNNNAADAPAVESANAADLSAVTAAQYIAIGS
jgi:hypothetical protein